ncbi:hypothetical protein EYR40_004480 [Pleurotus pulmonarius]|nr:hypothetical protein EYR40_004480 [Pleurotus pulmonarius]KAF4607179.1 hypothetical protein EYR38_001239 [Pleurotus pulmonarius]
MLSLLIPLLLLLTARATPHNVTVDDRFGSQTGSAIDFGEGWFDSGLHDCGASCQVASAFLKAENGTWKRSTYDQAETLDKPKVASFSFKGTAVYVNAILGEVTAAGVKGNSDVTFLLDDSVSYFLHNATSPTLLTIFSMTDLSNQNHTLTIVNGHPGGSFPQVMLFLDSIIYTTESSEEDVSTSPLPDARDADASSKPTRSDILIIIAISVGVGGIILGIFAYRLYLRVGARKKARQSFRSSVNNSRTSLVHRIVPFLVDKPPLPPSHSDPFERISQSPHRPVTHFSTVPPSYKSRQSTIDVS